MKQNNELREHNHELRENNSFLRSSAVNVEKNYVDIKNSYADAVLNLPKKQECARLTIKPKENFKGDALNIIKVQISTKTNAKVLKINKVNNGTVFLKCINEQDSEKILKVINSEILTAEACVKKNPQIKITNISEDVDKVELENDIIHRNELPSNSVNIVHKYKQRNNNHAALAEVTSDAYAKIMKNKSVFIGYENCRVYDNFNIKCCKNCCGYNHSLRKCKDTFKRQQSCYKCSGNHDATVCTSDINKCINCINANKYLTKKRSIDHSANDIQNCESYKVRWEQYICDTNYPWKPEPPFNYVRPTTS